MPSNPSPPKGGLCSSLCLQLPCRTFALLGITVCFNLCEGRLSWFNPVPWRRKVISRVKGIVRSAHHNHSSQLWAQLLRPYGARASLQISPVAR